MEKLSNIPIDYDILLLPQLRLNWIRLWLSREKYFAGKHPSSFSVSLSAVSILSKSVQRLKRQKVTARQFLSHLL